MKYSIPQLFWDDGQWIVFTIAETHLIVTTGTMVNEDDPSDIEWTLHYYPIHSHREWLLYSDNFSQYQSDEDMPKLLRVRWQSGALYFVEPQIVEKEAPLVGYVLKPVLDYDGYRVDHEGRKTTIGGQDFSPDVNQDTYPQAYRGSVQIDDLPSITSDDISLAQSCWPLQRMIPPMPAMESHVYTDSTNTVDSKYLPIWDMLYRLKQQSSSQEEYVQMLQYLLRRQPIFISTMHTAFIKLHDWLFECAPKVKVWNYTRTAIEREIRRHIKINDLSLAVHQSPPKVNTGYIRRYNVGELIALHQLFKKAFTERSIHSMSKAECDELYGPLQRLCDIQWCEKELHDQPQDRRQLLLLVQSCGMDGTPYKLDAMLAEVKFRLEALAVTKKNKNVNLRESQDDLFHEQVFNLLNDVDGMNDQLLQSIPTAVLIHWASLLFSETAVNNASASALLKMALRFSDEKIFKALPLSAQALITQYLWCHRDEVTLSAEKQKIEQFLSTRPEYQCQTITSQERAVLVYWAQIVKAGAKRKPFIFPDCKSIKKNIVICQESELLSAVIVCDGDLCADFLKLSQTKSVCKNIDFHTKSRLIALASRYPSVALQVALGNVAFEQADHRQELNQFFRLIISSSVHTQAAVALIRSNMIRLLEHEDSAIYELATHAAHGLAVVGELVDPKNEFAALSNEQLENIVKHYLDLLQNKSTDPNQAAICLQALQVVTASTVAWNHLSVLTKTRVSFAILNIPESEGINQASLDNVLLFASESPIMNLELADAEEQAVLLMQLAHQPGARVLRKLIHPNHVEVLAWQIARDRTLAQSCEKVMDYSEIDKPKKGYQNLLDMLITRFPNVAHLMVDEELLKSANYPVLQLIKRAGQPSHRHVAVALYKADLIPHQIHDSRFTTMQSQGVNMGSLLASKHLELANMMLLDNSKFLTHRNIGYVFDRLALVHDMRDPAFQTFVINLIERSKQYQCNKIENFALYKRQLIDKVYTGHDSKLKQRLLANSSIRGQFGFGVVLRLRLFHCRQDVPSQAAAPDARPR